MDVHIADGNDLLCASVFVEVMLPKNDTVGHGSAVFHIKKRVSQLESLIALMKTTFEMTPGFGGLCYSLFHLSTQ